MPQVAIPAPADEVRRLCGDLLDWKMTAILALRPTLAEVAEAASHAYGDDSGEARRPLDGRAAEVYDLLMSDAAEDEGG